jgi:hypothetical protein
MHVPKAKPDEKEHIDLGPDLDGRMRKVSPIENPWLKLPSQAPYVLEIDREWIEAYNQKKDNPDHKIDTLLIPEPFIGSPQSARLVLLSLNPGRDEEDAKVHANSDFRAALFRNLRHEPQGYPFYPLNPDFSGTPCAKWWLKLTKQLIDGLDRTVVAERLFVIEWFPYHSKKSGLPKGPKKFACESQWYSCQLAQEMRGKDALMVLLRSPDHWAVCEECFSRLPLPKSRQNPVMTSANFGEELFKRMRWALGNG